MRLRCAALTDAAALSKLYAPYVQHTCITFELEAPDAPEFERRLAQTMAQYPWLVAEDQGELTGFAYASQHRVRAAYAPSVDVAVYLAPRAQRVGLGRALSTALLGLLEAQGFHMAFAGIALPNEASVKLHERLGFTAVGVYRNVGFKLGSGTTWAGGSGRSRRTLAHRNSSRGRTSPLTWSRPS